MHFKRPTKRGNNSTEKKLFYQVQFTNKKEKLNKAKNMLKRIILLIMMTSYLLMWHLIYKRYHLTRVLNTSTKRTWSVLWWSSLVSTNPNNFPLTFTVGLGMLHSYLLLHSHDDNPVSFALLKRFHHMTALNWFLDTTFDSNSLKVILLSLKY